MWQAKGDLENSCPVETRKWGLIFEYFGSLFKMKILYFLHF